MARNIGKLDYLIAGNNDVVMFEDWWRGMVGVLDKFALTGPLSNAPGVTAGGRQQIERYVDKYQLTDDAGKNNPMSHELWLKYGKRAVRSNVNGFFMMAKMDTWYDAAFDGQNVFRPMNYRTFSGKKNNTPGMTGNEDELQSRWRKKGLRSAIALGSFVFHFRSVARGKKFAKSGWTRMEDLNYGL